MPTVGAIYYGAPIALRLNIGDGSDKFIGNGERDTCYSQGAKRNRCIGRGGDDICITGQRNSGVGRARSPATCPSPRR